LTKPTHTIGNINCINTMFNSLLSTKLLRYSVRNADLNSECNEGNQYICSELGIKPRAFHCPREESSTTRIYKVLIVIFILII